MSWLFEILDEYFSFRPLVLFKNSYHFQQIWCQLDLSFAIQKQSWKFVYTQLFTQRTILEDMAKGNCWPKISSKSFIEGRNLLFVSEIEHFWSLGICFFELGPITALF